MARVFTCAILVGCFALGFAATGTAEDDKNKCTIAVKGENPIVAACKQGGIKRAKVAMKAMAKLAKDKGMKTECDDCHKDEANGDWTLTKDGEEKFKKMLALVDTK